MKKFLLLAALCAVPALAQQAVPHRPCRVNCGAPCASLPPVYTLAIETESQFTVAFQYAVTGKRASGEEVTLRGVVLRIIQPGIDYTPVHLDFRGLYHRPAYQGERSGRDRGKGAVASPMKSTDVIVNNLVARAETYEEALKEARENFGIAFAMMRDAEDRLGDAFALCEAWRNNSSRWKAKAFWFCTLAMVEAAAFPVILLTVLWWKS